MKLMFRMSRFMMMKWNFGQVFYFYFSILGIRMKWKKPVCHQGRYETIPQHLMKY